jgi:hypothetical protein
LIDEDGDENDDSFIKDEYQNEEGQKYRQTFETLRDGQKFGQIEFPKRNQL